MKQSPLRPWSTAYRPSLAALLCFALLFAPGAALVAAGSQNAADIAVIDRAIASARIGQERVSFGDVGMRVSDLKIFRDRLAGKISPQTQHERPQPLADTPNGTAFKWPGGNVYYRFDPTQVPGTITAAKMQQFRDSVGEWAAFAALHFIEFTGTPPANYITVQQSAPGNEGGFSSSVGMAGGEQFIQIGANSWNRGTVCHEVGHAIGYYHEQQRDDRDTYVIINFSNIDPAQQGNFTKLPSGSTARGAYDFYSVMHYSRSALSNNGQDTISMQPAYSQFIDIIGNVYDRTLSKLDRADMAIVYGNPSPVPSAIVTNANDSGPGSLRSAIYYAFDKSTDAPPVPTSVIFNIPAVPPGFDGSVFTISPTSLLVAPGATTTIDGSTQTSFTGNTNANGPEVVINGSQIAVQNLSAAGFILRDANCTVKNLTINGFNQWGILIFGASATNNVVSGCYLGTDAAGSGAAANSFPGVEINAGAHGNVVGGTTAAARNIISGNNHYGVSINGAGTNSNVVTGNYIGLNAAGTGSVPNISAGVAIFGGAQNNTIGGTTSSARNVISGNKNQGARLYDAGTSANIVRGNYIGLNAAGSAAVGNGFADPASHVYTSGIDIFGGAQSNIIGGTIAGSGNVISGNGANGIGLIDPGTNANLVQGNFIGTNPAGNAAIPNGSPEPNRKYSGIVIFNGAQTSVVGGSTAGAANLISGNGGPGVLIDGAGTNSHTVQGNLIGVNAAGNAALSNGYYGVGVFGGAQFNSIGGTSVSARNIISGNGFNGVAIAGTGTNQNVVAGNFIGVDAAGANAIGNGFSGVSVFGEAQSNTVGGTTTGTRNVISANGSDDIEVSGLNTTGNFVQGNFVGLNAAGSAAIPNSNSGIGVFGNAQNNTVGGTSAGARNFIAGHANYGLFIADAGTNGNFVQGNTVGLSFTGAAIGNGAANVAVFGTAQGNTIGGSALGASNIISGGSVEGVALFDANTFKNLISRNSIYANGAKGIALYNGTNNGQSSPNLTSATLSTPGNPAGTDIVGSLTSAANTIYTIEFFASPTGDPSGFGEGQFFVGSTVVTTNGAGTVNFGPISLAAAPSAGYVMAATATDPNNNTSELSPVLTVTTTDTDGDGMPNNWETAHMLNPGSGADASLDSDGDGSSNLQEYKAGTDPRDPTSRFAITAVDRSTGNPRVTFKALAGKTYRLEYRDDLSSGSWNTLLDQISSNVTTSLQIIDPSAGGLNKRFYRIDLEP